MDLTVVIEMIIRQAVERGELQNLPGEGKPIELKGINPFETKEDRMMNRLIAAAGELPLEVILLKEIEKLQQRLEECELDSEKQILKRQLGELKIKYEIQKEARLDLYKR